MAYTAYLNNEIFFDTEADSNDYKLTAAKLDLQLGSSGSFSFTVPPVNAFYGQLQKLVDYVDVYRDKDLIFSGRVYSCGEQFDTQQSVVCEGLLAILNDSIFRPVTFDGELYDLVLQILRSHNAQVETQKQIQRGVWTVSNTACYRAYENYETSISRLQDLRDAFGGFMRVRKSNGQLYLDWYEACIDGCDQAIDFGENLIELTQESDSNGICTVLIPLGAEGEVTGERLTVKTVNGGLDYITAPDEYIQKYGYIVGVNIWDDVHYPDILKKKGEEWLSACLSPRLTINVTAVDLADAGYDVESFRIGQRLKVRSAPHKLTGEWFDVQKQSLDLLNPGNNRLSVGTEVIGYIRAQRSDASAVRLALERIVSTYTTQSYLQQAVENATRLITGNEGGYIILHDSDEDGEPDELLVMDTSDIETAVKVWRFNNSGLGFSSSGYEGPYGTAITMDGQIVADYITAGTFNGSLIKTGIIQSMSGGSWWNLETGELHVEGMADIDKSKVFIRTPSTPYYVGDLWVTEFSQQSAVAGVAIASRAIVGDDSVSEGGTIMVCQTARLSGNFNSADWVLVTNYIDDTELQELADRVQVCEINVSTLNNTIQMKADTSVVTDLASRVTAAEILVDGYDSRITANTTYIAEVAEKRNRVWRQEPVPPYYLGDLWVTGIHEPYHAIVGEAIAGVAIASWGRDILICNVERTDEKDEFHLSDWTRATDYISDDQLTGLWQSISNAQLDIDAANARILLKADETTVTNLASRVSSAELTINAHAGQIQSKVSLTDYTGATIASLINQSADSVTIQAKHISLTGQNIADRINSADSTVTIEAGHINLNGATTLNNSLVIDTAGNVQLNNATFYGKKTATYTEANAQKCAELAQKKSWTAAQLKLYDFNGDGRISAMDYVTVRNIVNNYDGSYISELNIEPNSINETLTITDNLGHETAIGPQSVITNVVNCDTLMLNDALFKITSASFNASLSGSAAEVYWKEGEIEVKADTGYEIVGLGGYYISTNLNKAYCINVYRAEVHKDDAKGKFYFRYGFANTGVTTQTVTCTYYLLEAYTKAFQS